MLNDNKISEIKIILETLLKDLGDLSENEMVSHIKWEEILTSASLLSIKLNTLRIEQERNHMKQYLPREEADSNFESSGNEVKRLGYTITQLKREIADLRLNISRSTLPEAFTSAVKPVLSAENPYYGVQPPDSPFEQPVGTVTQESEVPSSPEYKEQQQPNFTKEAAPTSLEIPFSDSSTEGLPTTQDEAELDFLLDKRSLMDIKVSKSGEPEWLSDIPGSAVEDIHMAINLNDKLCFIRELFNGDSDQYRLSIQRVNEMGTFAEALDYTRNAFPHWDEDSNAVYRFYMAVRRRYADG